MDKITDFVFFGNEKQEDIDVEWHSGGDLYTHPRRIKVNGIWEEVFHYERIMREDASSKTRELVFRCHIGDNRIVVVVKKLLTN